MSFWVIFKHFLGHKCTFPLRINKFRGNQWRNNNKYSRVYPVKGNIKYINFNAASWRKRLGARLPPLGSRVRVSVTPCGVRGGRNGVWVRFSRGFYHKFHSTISPYSPHPFRFISSALVMVRQAWSAGTLATYGPII